MWRREHQSPYKGSEIFNAISEELEKRKIVPIKMRYSKKAGCNMCPCSPGYIVYCEGERYVGPMRTAIWLEEVDGENKS